MWFRLHRPLIEGEDPSSCQRVAVAADSGNCTSAVLDFERYIVVNCDLTINLLRRPLGELICADARALLAPNGRGLAEWQLFDETGLIGRHNSGLRTSVLKVRAGLPTAAGVRRTQDRRGGQLVSDAQYRHKSAINSPEEPQSTMHNLAVKEFQASVRRPKL